MQATFSEFPPNVTERQRKILGWPTDTLSIDYPCHCKDDNSTIETPHTILIFIPGNPGQYDWYVSDLCALVQLLGQGFAVRAVSQAGHSLRGVQTAEEEGIVNVKEYAKKNQDADPAIPWTIHGQVQHKAAFMDDVVSEFADRDTNSPTAPSSPSPRFIFLGHSFGCHVVQQLCKLRPKILNRTIGFLHLMPFIRMKADFLHQCKLDWGAQHPKTLLALGNIMAHSYRLLPKAWVNALFKFSIHNDKPREIAVQLMRQPSFVQNFFTLGTEEIRDIPKDIDVSAYKGS
jgi:pimeloyl-ACP methyl ester carboxylesterase